MRAIFPSGFPLHVPVPRSPDPAGDLLPLLRGLHFPGGDPAPGWHQLPALRDRPEHVVSWEGLEIPWDGPGQVRDAPFGVFPTPLEVSVLGHPRCLGTFPVLWDIAGVMIWDIPGGFGTFLVSIPLFQALLAGPGGGCAHAASPGPFPVPGAAFPGEGDH